MITAGRLDQRVTVQSCAPSRDAVGGPTEVWSDVATVWARVAPLSGKRIAQAQQVGSSVSKEVEIRWRSDISAAMRIKFADNSVAKVGWVEDYKRQGRIVLVVEAVDG